MGSQSVGSEAGDGGQDLISGFGPAEGFRLLVMGGDELPDGGFQFGYAAMGAALDLPLGE